MDLDLSPDQSHRIELLRTAVEAYGTERIRDRARSGTYDPALHQQILELGIFEDVTPLDGCLLVEEAARLGLTLPLGAAVLVAEVLPEPLPEGSVIALTRARRPGPARFAPMATHAIVVGDPETPSRLCELEAGQVCRVSSSFPYPYGEISPFGGTVLPEHLTAALRLRWKLAAAAEIVGCLRAAVDWVAGHLARREQFGVKLASFQALQHRMAELVVSAEASAWLTRLAAYEESDELATQAADYVRQAAASTSSEVTQLTGARGLTVAFELFIWSMRMTALRLELVSLTQRTASPYAKAG